MYNSSPISRGRSAGDEGWKGYIQIAKAIRGSGLQPGIEPASVAVAVGKDEVPVWKSDGGGGDYLERYRRESITGGF